MVFYRGQEEWKGGGRGVEHSKITISWSDLSEMSENITQKEEWNFWLLISEVLVRH